MACGGLNENVPHRPTGNSTFRRRGLVGVGVILLEEVCYQGIDSEVSETQVRPSVSLSLPAACGSRCRTLSYFSSTMSTNMLLCSSL